MPTKLDQLLDSIDPDRVLSPVSARVDEAINTFPIRIAQIVDWNQFKRHLTDFVVHVEQKGLRLRAPVRMSAEFEWGRCVHMLIAKYGRDGDKVSFDLARTGKDGGLYEVEKKVAWHRRSSGLYVPVWPSHEGPVEAITRDRLNHHHMSLYSSSGWIKLRVSAGCMYASENSWSVAFRTAIT